MSFLTPEAPTVTPTPIIPPVAPTEETSVQVGAEEDALKKKKTGKSSLKLPLVDTTESGLRI